MELGPEKVVAPKRPFALQDKQRLPSWRPTDRGKTGNLAAAEALKFALEMVLKLRHCLLTCSSGAESGSSGTSAGNERARVCKSLHVDVQLANQYSQRHSAQNVPEGSAKFDFVYIAFELVIYPTCILTTNTNRNVIQSDVEGRAKSP